MLHSEVFGKTVIFSKKQTNNLLRNDPVSMKVGTDAIHVGWLSSLEHLSASIYLL